MDAPRTRWRVRELLKDKGWSPEELHEQTKRYNRGLPLQTINDICGNKTRGFTLYIVGVLARVLECEVADLIEVTQ